MRSEDVEINGVYQAKVSNKQTKVKVLSSYIAYNGRTGFNVVNLSTGRQIRFHSAARLKELPQSFHYFLDSNGENKEITRQEAIQIVHNVLGVGTWQTSFGVARKAEGLSIPGFGQFRIRTDKELTKS